MDTILSYLVKFGDQGEVVDYAPHDFREHTVLDIYDKQSVNEQIYLERKGVPSGCYVEWYSIKIQ